MFVIRCGYDEQLFENGAGSELPQASSRGVRGCRGDGDRKWSLMAALVLPSPGAHAGGRRRTGGPQLAMVGPGHRIRQLGDGGVAPGQADAPFLTVVPDPVRMRRSRRRVSPTVRRRRLLLAVAGLLVIGLALPLGGTGGRSHAAGSALAETGRTVEYIVQPGDTLWSIAERVKPTGDPRPLVAQLASQTGSYNVQPGERIAVP